VAARHSSGVAAALPVGSHDGRACSLPGGLTAKPLNQELTMTGLVLSFAALVEGCFYYGFKECFVDA
jgi:hypothetical protein